MDPARIAVAGQVAEVFGDADPINRADTFLSVPGQGVFFYQPQSALPFDIDLRMQALLSRRHNSTSGESFWGAVLKDDHGQLISAVTAVDAKSGITAGQFLRIGDLTGRKYDFSYVLRDAEGAELWRDGRVSAAMLPSQGSQLDCRQNDVELKGFVVNCALLRGPPWQLSALAHDDVIMSRARSLLWSTAPWTFLALLLLLLVIALILQYRLGRPLGHIVDIIHRQKGVRTLSYRLPEGRKDELGRIAKAYNSLLRTLSAHQQTLENKFSERTRELDMAKRMAERANRLKTEHLTSISHEIRTPLNGIVGALSLLEIGDWTCPFKTGHQLPVKLMLLPSA